MIRARDLFCYYNIINIYLFEFLKKFSISIHDLKRFTHFIDLVINQYIQFIYKIYTVFDVFDKWVSIKKQQHTFVKSDDR